MQVDVYRNLNKGGLSVRSREKESYGRVFLYVDEVVVKNPQFVVQPSGRERLLEEGRKNVHAFVRGKLRGWFEEPPSSTIFVNYHPYHRSDFIDTSTGEPIRSGKIAWVREDGVRVVT